MGIYHLPNVPFVKHQWWRYAYHILQLTLTLKCPSPFHLLLPKETPLRKNLPGQMKNYQKYVFIFQTGGQKLIWVTRKSAKKTPFSDDAYIYTKLVETNL